MRVITLTTLAKFFPAALGDVDCAFTQRMGFLHRGLDRTK